MKIRSTFHVLVLLMAVLTFSMPFVTFAQQASVADEQAKAVADGERDAEARVSKGLWFGVGCLTTVLGTILAYSLAPTPPAEQLIGKSPDYVDFYTTAYQAKAKSLQGRSALTGAGITLGVTAIGTVVVYGCLLGTAAGAAASVEVE
ncbi:MAG: hypothetical protein OXC79_09510 [Candidatus Poribacteria bacterium]|nr:hypothetical protein [Candidatus Poribacteria bacterium]